jgi:polysaccharide biosynthesis protein PslH
MVERLHKHHDVTCLAFAHDKDDADGARELRRFGVRIVTVPYRPYLGLIKSAYAMLSHRPFTTTFFGSGRLVSELRRRMPETDLAIAFSSSMGAYLLDWPAVPRILHFCELDSDKWRQYATHTRPPMRWVYERETRVLEALERRLAANMDSNIVCTELEQRVFVDRIPGAACTVMRNGVDLEYFSPEGLAPEPGHIVFTGVMSYFPNIDACRWFVSSVLPEIARRHPEARFTIVGSGPSSDVRRLTRDARVTVTGPVADTRPYLRRAAVVVAPLRIARGVQNKVLEGLAMGVPVVATRVAVQGVGGTAGRDYRVANDASAMAETIGDLLSNESERAALGARGRAFVVATYGWDRSLDVLDEIIASVVSPATPGLESRERVL